MLCHTRIQCNTLSRILMLCHIRAPQVALVDIGGGHRSGHREQQLSGGSPPAHLPSQALYSRWTIRCTETSQAVQCRFYIEVCKESIVQRNLVAWVAWPSNGWPDIRADCTAADGFHRLGTGVQYSACNSFCPPLISIASYDIVTHISFDDWRQRICLWACKIHG